MLPPPKRYLLELLASWLRDDAPGDNLWHELFTEGSGVPVKFPSWFLCLRKSHPLTVLPRILALRSGDSHDSDTSSDGSRSTFEDELLDAVRDAVQNLPRRLPGVGGRSGSTVVAFDWKTPAAERRLLEELTQLESATLVLLGGSSVLERAVDLLLTAPSAAKVKGFLFIQLEEGKETDETDGLLRVDSDKWKRFSSECLAACEFVGFSGLRVAHEFAAVLAGSLDVLSPRTVWLDCCRSLAPTLAASLARLLQRARRVSLTGSDPLWDRWTNKLRAGHWETVLIEESGELPAPLVKELARANSGLRVLQLPYCGLRPRTFSGTDQSLARMSALRVLNLSGNQLGDPVCARLLAALPKGLHCVVLSFTAAGRLSLSAVKAHSRLMALGWSGGVVDEDLAAATLDLASLAALDLRGCEAPVRVGAKLFKKLAHMGLSRAAATLLRRRSRKLPESLRLWAPELSPTPPRPRRGSGGSDKENKRPAPADETGGGPKKRAFVAPAQNEAAILHAVAAAYMRIVLAAPAGAGQSYLLSLLGGDPLPLVLAFRLLLRTRTTSVTLADVARLEDIRPQTPQLRFLQQMVLEELALKSLTLKYQRHNQLDYDDCLNVPGAVLYDGGAHVRAMSAAEFKLLWLKRHGVDFSRPRRPSERALLLDRLLESKDTDVCSTPEPPSRRRPSAWGDQLDWFRDLDEYCQVGRCPHAVAVRSPGALSSAHAAAACHQTSSSMAGFEFIEDTATRLSRLSAPSAPPMCECRETLVVDVESDGRLRRLLQQAHALQASCRSLAQRPARDGLARGPVRDPDSTLLEGLKTFLLRRVHLDNDGAASRAAAAAGGFVALGELRTGQTRHLALLFKVLCDALGIPCKLVRWSGGSSETAFNVALLPAKEDTLEAARAVWWSRRPAAMTLHPVDSLLLRFMDEEVVDLATTFDFCRLIGKGSFGEVWHVRLRDVSAESFVELPTLLRRWRTAGGERGGGGSPSSYDFALKLVDWEPSALTEARFVQHYTHPCIVELLAVFKGSQVLQTRQAAAEQKLSLCLLMDLADCSLETLLTAHEAALDAGRRLECAELRQLLLDTARAMAYLHHSSASKPHVLHRDLKPANILVKKCGELRRAFVADFGLAYQFHSAEDAMTMGAGTEGYIAPEQYSRSYGRPADVWSFGVIVGRCLGVAQWRTFAERPVRRAEIRLWDDGLARLCAACLQEDPLLRPDFGAVVDVLTDEILRAEFDEQLRRAAAARNL